MRALKLAVGLIAAVALAWGPLFLANYWTPAAYIGAAIWAVLILFSFNANFRSR